jgi:Holliday junction resolvase
MTFIAGRGNVERVTVEELIAAYKETGSVYAVGKRFGIHGSSVHERLQRHAPGLVKKPRRWTPENLRLLADHYEHFASKGKLDELAKKIGIGKTSVCAKAAQLGFTDTKRKRPYQSVWMYMPEEDAGSVWDEFKTSRLGLIAWCKRKGYDDLGFSRCMKKYFGDEWESVMEAKQPRQSLYRRGRQFEYVVRDHLRKAGFFAQRSPASKSPLDIMAVRPGEVWMVQCKRHGALGVAEWNELFITAKAAGAVPVLAMVGPKRGAPEFYVLFEKKDGSKRAQPMTRVYPMP